MQGHAPIISITVNRRYCEFCGERVSSKSFHVCWGNVEYHIHSISEEQRTHILAQLESKPTRLTRAQLKKLYAADGLGPAKY